MRRCAPLGAGWVAMCFAVWGAQQYELSGTLQPPARAAISLHGATAPFEASAMADDRGRFVFRGLDPGAYTLAVFVPGAGDARRTIDVGPGTANARGRVEVTLDLESLSFSTESLRRAAQVSASELKISDKARKEYDEAQKKLSRRQVGRAVEHLERAVRLSPGFVAAWNHLGTIAYQTRRYLDAERYFRAALERDREAFEPIVNLGGVLLTLGKLDEALEYNLYATLARPKDALANSQLGLSYFLAGNPDLARKYLKIAKALDPAHFSYPQLTLAEIALREKNPREAAAEFEDFLKHHPDAPQAAKIRAAIGELR